MRVPFNHQLIISTFLISTLLVSFTLLFTFCGAEKTETVAAPEGMHTLDLSKYGKQFSIFVPDTIKAKLQITEQTNGALDIKVGKNFAISINEMAADLAQIKEDLKSDEVNKLTSIMVDEPTAIMWESEVVQPEFHFFLNQKVNESEYSFEDIKSTENDPFSKEAVQKMLDVCKKIQPKTTSK